MILTNLTRKSVELSQPQSSPNHRPLKITFGILPGNVGENVHSASSGASEIREKPAASRAVNDVSEVEASEKMDEGEDACQDAGQGKNDNQPPRGERPGSDTTVRRDGSESPRGEKTKMKPPTLSPEPREVNMEEAETISILSPDSPEFIPRMRRLTSENDISKIGLDDIIVNGPGNDFVSDDYTGVGDVVIL